MSLSVYPAGQSDGGGGVAWVNPANATGAPNAVTATAALAGAQSTSFLLLDTLGLVIPPKAYVAWIRTTIRAANTDVSGESSINAKVYNGTTPMGVLQFVPLLSGTLTDYVLGGPAGGFWSANLRSIPAANLRIGVQQTQGSGAGTASLDAVNVEVGYVYEGPRTRTRMSRR